MQHICLDLLTGLVAGWRYATRTSRPSGAFQSPLGCQLLATYLIPEYSSHFPAIFAVYAWVRAHRVLEALGAFSQHPSSGRTRGYHPPARPASDQTSFRPLPLSFSGFLPPVYACDSECVLRITRCTAFAAATLSTIVCSPPRTALRRR